EAYQMITWMEVENFLRWTTMIDRGYSYMWQPWSSPTMQEFWPNGDPTISKGDTIATREKIWSHFQPQLLAHHPWQAIELEATIKICRLVKIHIKDTLLMLKIIIFGGIANKILLDNPTHANNLQ
ncbi:hypothetical protein ACJX0J_031103, partial [Zea mays]